jgi:hypothetical protein
VREAEDEFRFRRACILDVVERAGRHEKHLARRDREARSGALIAEDRDQRIPAQAIAELVTVGVPVRLAHAQRLEQQPSDRQPLEDRKDRRLDHGDAAAGHIKAWRLVGQRHHVCGRFLHGNIP